MCAAEERRPCGSAFSNSGRPTRQGGDCLRPRRGRVPQPPAWSSTAGEPEGPARLGSPFLWLLSFGEAKESNLPPGNPRRTSSCRDNVEEVRVFTLRQAHGERSMAPVPTFPLKGKRLISTPI